MMTPSEIYQLASGTERDELHLVNCSLGHEHWKELARAISNGTVPPTIVIRDHLVDEDLAVLGEAIAKSQAVVHLDIAANPISRLGVVDLLKRTGKREDFTVVIDEHLSSLVPVEMRVWHIGSAGAIVTSRALPPSQWDVANQLQELSGKDLTKRLTDLSSIQTITSPEFTAKEIYQLATGTERDALELVGFSLDEEHYEALAKAIREGRTPPTLILRTKIQDAQLAILAEAIGSNDCIVHLDITGNPITEEGVEALVDKTQGRDDLNILVDSHLVRFIPLPSQSPWTLEKSGLPLPHKFLFDQHLPEGTVSANDLERILGRENSPRPIAKEFSRDPNTWDLSALAEFSKVWSQDPIDIAMRQGLVISQLQSLKLGNPTLPLFGLAEIEQLSAELKTTFVFCGIDSSGATYSCVPGQEATRALRKNPLDLKQWSTQIRDLEVSMEEEKSLSLRATHPRQHLPAEASSDATPQHLPDSLLAEATDQSSFIQFLRDAYESFVQPIRKFLPSQGGARVCFVPDWSIAHLPFGAFLGPDETYLIEQFTVYTAPSVNVLRQALQLRRTFSPPTGGFVGVFDPKDAVSEAFEEGLLFSEGEILLQNDALPDIDSFKAASILHLAAPITRGSIEGAFSGTIPFSDGELSAKAIWKNDLRPPLVVMSRCCHNEYPSLHVGPEKAFLATGSGTVIHTSWSLDLDPATNEIVAALYQHLKSSPPAEALRQSILEQIKTHRKSPWKWAGFGLDGLPDA